MQSIQGIGKIIDVDLTSGTVDTRDYDRSTARSWLGGLGFNTMFLYEHLPENCNPLGPENILLISPGLLTGTAAPSSSRVHINALSPLSGLIGSSSVGGGLGMKLRTLDIRSIIIRGASPVPVYLQIDDGGVRVVPAEYIWTLDTRSAEEAIKAETGSDKAEILCIGRAGENRVRYACIMAGIDHSAGHTGLGSVMGSKNLKAISVQAEKKPAPSSSEVRTVVRNYIKSIRSSVSRYNDYSTLGSAGDILEMNEMGVLGTKNYRSGQIEEVQRIDGRNLKSYVTRNITCPRCPVHCKAEVMLGNGRHRGFCGGRPEYETIINLGSLCGLSDPEELIYLSNLCNILGIDTISAGSVIAFAMDLYERKILTDEDTGGIPLTWGNADAMEQIMYKIAEREGIGDVLAEGVFRAAGHIGRGADKFAYHVKGVELYGADPRGIMGTALAYAVSMRGGDFTSVYPVPEFRYTPEQAEAAFGTPKAADVKSTEGKGALVRHCIVVSAVIDSLGICKVPALSIAGGFELEQEASLASAVTGIDFTAAELFRIGEKTVNMEKLINLRFGGSSVDDRLPELFVNEPITAGPAAGCRVDLKPMVEDFYRSMGWDSAGRPLTDTLERLQLREIKLTTT